MTCTISDARGFSPRDPSRAPVKVMAVAFALALAFFLPDGRGVRAAASSAGGVVVSKVGADGLAIKAGLREGDRLLRWSRGEGRGGAIESVAAFGAVEAEERPRGEVTLEGERAGRPISWKLAAGTWGLEARPLFSAKERRRFNRAAEEAEGEQGRRGAEEILKLSERAEHGGQLDKALWLALEAAKRAGGAEVAEAAERALDRAVLLAGGEAGTEFRAYALERAGSIAQKSEALARAEVIYRELRGLLSADPNSLRLALCLDQLAKLAWQRGKPEEAKSLWTEAHAVREREAPESEDLAKGWINLGFHAMRSGDLALAEELYGKALATSERWRPGSLDVAACLHNLGNVKLYQADHERAGALFKRALAIRESLAPNSLTMADTMANMGVLAYDTGNLLEAERRYREVLAVRERLAPGSQGVAAMCNNLGNVTSDRGDLALAEDLYRRALQIKERLAPESLEVAGTLSNLGSVCRDRLDYAGAEAHFKRALAIKERLAPKSLTTAGTYLNLGSLYGMQGDYGLSEEYLLKALDLIRKAGTGSLQESQVLVNLGNVESHRGRDERAVELYREALAGYGRLFSGSLREAGASHSLGQSLMDLGRLEEAEASLHRALEIRRRLAEGSYFVAETLNLLGRLERRRGRAREALSYFELSVAALESQLGKLGGGEEGRSGFRAGFSSFYRDLIVTQHELGLDAEAFLTLEKTRARELLALLAERDIQFERDAPPDLLQKRRETEHDLDEARKGLEELDPAKEADAVEESLAEIRRLEEERKFLAEKIRAASPKLASLEYPEIAGSKRASEILPPDTLFLSYCLGEEKTLLFALMGGRLKVHELGENSQKLGERARLFRRLASGPGTDIARLNATAEELYGILLGHVEPLLKSAKRLLICPEGPLHGLPFAALRTREGEYLVELIPSHTELSATLHGEHLTAPTGPAGEGKIAAFGDPLYPQEAGAASKNPVLRLRLGGRLLGRLAASRREVKEIASLFPGRVSVHLGGEASEEEAKRLQGDFSVVHFACHALADERFPLESGLLLSLPDIAQATEDGFLQAWEIFESLRFNAGLVVLSACESAMGKEMGGEGMVGLTRAFQYAGAQSVLSSLWSVGDESTAQMMKGFYGYLKEGKPKAEALRLAQVDMILQGSRQACPGLRPGDGAPADTHPSPLAPRPSQLSARRSNYSHPFYWAAFVLAGNGN